MSHCECTRWIMVCFCSLFLHICTMLPVLEETPLQPSCHCDLRRWFYQCKILVYCAACVVFSCTSRSWNNVRQLETSWNTAGNLVNSRLLFGRSVSVSLVIDYVCCGCLRHVAADSVADVCLWMCLSVCLSVCSWQQLQGV